MVRQTWAEKHRMKERQAEKRQCSTCCGLSPLARGPPHLRSRLRARAFGGGDFLSEKLIEGAGDALRWAAFDDAPIWHAVA